MRPEPHIQFHVDNICKSTLSTIDDMHSFWRKKISHHPGLILEFLIHISMPVQCWLVFSSCISWSFLAFFCKDELGKLIVLLLEDVVNYYNYVNWIQLQFNYLPAGLHVSVNSKFCMFSTPRIAVSQLLTLVIFGVH